MTESAEHANRKWWGRFDVAPRTSAFWQIGPLKLWIHRDEHELFVARERGLDPLDETFAIEIPTRGKEGPDATISRYAVRGADDTLVLEPALANRPLVVNPATQFYLPPKQEATVFVSSALWFRLLVGEPPTLLEDEATFRPSDTWFGPSTRSGELCYATKSTARLRLDDVPMRPHRAVSAVRVRNRADSELRLNQLRLPMAHLSLFVSPKYRLWTETLVLERDEDGGLASVRFEEGPPPEAGPVEPLTPPRRKTEGGFLFDAFGGFLTRKKENVDE